MERKYREIEKKVRNEGFFSEYLPPCFKVNRKIFLKVPQENCDLIPPYCFTMSRFDENDSRRNIYIPEIGAYTAAYQYMRDNKILEELIQFTEQNGGHSFSPILDENDSPLRHEQVYSEKSGDSIYIKNVVKKIIRSKGAKKILMLDISNCFSSFYCHMIPAIPLGLEKTKEEYKKYLRSSENIDEVYKKYKGLDDIIRRQNENRTNGLLVGPSYTRIIMEGVLTRIDMELEQKGISFSRYVDNYEVYLYNADDEKRYISIFTEILKNYGFSLNFEKTKVVDFPYYIVENLDKIIECYRNSNREDSDLMSLFNHFLTLEQNGTKGAIRYLLKSLEKSPIEIKDEHKDLIKSYLLTILSNDERSLGKACALLITGNGKNSLDEEDIRVLNEMLKMHIAMNHDLEVLWLLYVLIKCGKISSKREIVSLIIESKNELAQAMLLRKELLTQEEKVLVKEQAESWILLYELYATSLLEEEELTQKLGLFRNKEMYAHMKRNEIHFLSFD